MDRARGGSGVIVVNPNVFAHADPAARPHRAGHIGGRAVVDMNAPVPEAPTPAHAHLRDSHQHARAQ
ncbi:MAG: hypothetical protein R2851_09130 [Caldilineaceae bacterium]